MKRQGDFVKNNISLFDKIAKERINYEIMKLFGGDKCQEILLLMDEVGILEMIFPCIIEMKKVTPNTHHHLDLFHHSIETVKNIEKLYKELENEQKEEKGE